MNSFIFKTKFGSINTLEKEREFSAKSKVNLKNKILKLKKN